MDYEAFVYLWFDSKNRMFYLGFHKGHEDDGYTHSSSIMESFSKKKIPPYMRRRILARGSCDDMAALEVSLLKNRKEKCWDRYYNVMAHWPPPCGEDHPSYIDGRSSDPEYIRNLNLISGRKYRKNNPEKAREACRNYYKKSRKEILKKKEEYYQKNQEEIREKKREYVRKYRKEHPERARESARKFREKLKKPGPHRERYLKYQQQYRAKNKLEKSLQTA